MPGSASCTALVGILAFMSCSQRTRGMEPGIPVDLMHGRHLSEEIAEEGLEILTGMHRVALCLDVGLQKALKGLCASHKLLPGHE